MPPEQRGLLETPPGRVQVETAIAVCIVLLVGFAGVHALGEIPLRELPVFIPVVDAMLFVSDLFAAILLFTQASVFRSRALMALASGYLFTALVAAAHALTFPGAFSPTGLLGGNLNSSAWLAVCWRAGFALSAGLYAAFKPRMSLRFKRPSTGIITGVGASVGMAIAVSILATREADLLPPLVVAPRVWYYPAFVPANAILIALCLGAITALMRGRKSRLDVWLLLSLSAWLMHLLLILSSSGRFTLAWYFAQGAGLVSHLIVVLGVITDAGRTYAQLAMSISARDQERDTRLMSMDAVAAAIAHEVRQPLAAMVTDASAGLRWLDRVPPNLEMAMKSLRANVDQGHRASDLIDSIRSVLAHRRDERTTFSLNALVRETVALLDRDLARARITLLLMLDERLPPIVADRLQIQQVLVNLITNAIQSLKATRGYPRRITMRSAPLGGSDVLVEVSDNGLGIAAEQMQQIFDFFFTTKPKGTGIGLTLCRTIVEDHGGHLWASQGETPGANFHLQLPRSGMPATDDAEAYGLSSAK
jgi:signal transduction histidine kinase